MTRGHGASRLRFRLVPTILLTIAILALPTVVYAWGRSSSSFAIEKVVVTGAERVSEERLQRLVRRRYAGRNLFTVTSADVGKTLARFSYVAAVSVDRDFPATLRVRVEEHVPVASVLAGERWYAVSTKGVIITSLGHAAGAADDPDAGSSTVGGEDSGDDGSAAGQPAEGTTASPAATPLPSTSGSAAGDEGDALADPAGDAEAQAHAAEELAALEAGPPDTDLDLPRLAANEPVRAGRELEDTDARLAVAVVAGLPTALRRNLAVAAADDGWVTLRFADGLEAVWGDGERSLAKGIAMRLVLGRYEKKGVRCTSIDVSTPDRVLARPELQ